MMKLTTLAGGVMLTLSAYSGLASANSGSVDFSAAITAHNTDVCTLSVTPPTATTSGLRYTLGKDGAPGVLTELSHIEGPLVVQAAGGQTCRLGKIRFQVTGDSNQLNGKDVLGKVTQNGKGMWPYTVSFGYADALLRSQPASYKVLTIDGREWTEKDWGSGVKNPYTKSDGRNLISQYNTLKDHSGFPVQNGIIKTVGVASADGSYLFDIYRFATAWNFADADEFRIGLGELVAIRPYNLDTGLPDDSVVEDGETITATATVTVTPA